MPETTNDKLNELFTNFTHVLKYIVVFILYVFAFNYMYVRNTVPISFILLLFLHISILVLVIGDFNTLSRQYGYSIFYDNLWFPISLLVFLGPLSCWVMVFIAISFIISLFSKLKLYNNVEKTDDLEETESFEMGIIKILIILSTIVFAILYGFVYSGLLQQNKLQEGLKIQEGLKTFLVLDQESTLIPRLIITTILLVSFVVYFLLTNASNTIIGLGISFIILLYLFNFFYQQFKNKYLDRFFSIIFIISIFAIFTGIIYIIYVNAIEYLYALIPSFVWFFYIYYMIFNNVKKRSNMNSIYLYSSLVIILYIVTGLLFYYGGVARGLWGER